MLDFLFGGPVDWHAAFNPPRRFPVGHIREYDPTGEYTYRDQNPKFKENA